MSAIVQLVQGSPEWHAYRRGMRNASETPAVLGISPWVTPYQLWLQKTGRSESTTNAAMQRGTALEPMARHAYEVETGNVMQPLVLQDGAYSASLDGMTLGGELIVEIKVPMRGRDSSLWKAVAGGDVPAHYVAQIQHQLMVCGAEKAHLWVFDGQVGLLHVIEPDASAAGAIRAAWEAFAVFLDTDAPPPLVDADQRPRDDEAWLQAAVAFREAKEAAEAAAAALDASRACLVALASHPKEAGAGVTVTRFWKAGSVDYKKVVELKGVDLERYRGKVREEVRVTVA
ncbi:MAG: YqaJ viral recombinase family protein [Burkholderiales bacterium]|nr:YqaJ viral recombinase family protein [Burkholderiales bacterium]MDE2160966.1 YqaJ viral recombinase family protein [Burkholderiales bacterium]